jgi:hypothetical protein
MHTLTMLEVNKAITYRIIRKSLYENFALEKLVHFDSLKIKILVYILSIKEL